MFCNAKEALLHCLLVSKEDHRIFQVGGDFRRSLVQFPAQSKVKTEFRPGCSGLCQLSVNLQRWGFSTLWDSLFQWLTVLIVLFFPPTLIARHLPTLLSILFQFSKSFLSPLCITVKRSALSPQWHFHRHWELLLGPSEATSPLGYTSPATPASSHRPSVPRSKQVKRTASQVPS